MNSSGNAYFASWPMVTPRYSWRACVAREKRRGRWTFLSFQDTDDLPTQEGHAAAIFPHLYKISAFGALGL